VGITAPTRTPLCVTTPDGGAGAPVPNVMAIPSGAGPPTAVITAGPAAHAKSISQLWDRHFARTGLPRIPFRDLPRHSGLLVNTGAPIKASANVSAPSRVHNGHLPAPRARHERGRLGPAGGCARRAKFEVVTVHTVHTVGRRPGTGHDGDTTTALRRLLEDRRSPPSVLRRSPHYRLMGTGQLRSVHIRRLSRFTVDELDRFVDHLQTNWTEAVERPRSG